MDQINLDLYLADDDFDQLHGDFYYMIFEKLFRKFSMSQLLSTMASDSLLFHVGCRFLNRVTILHLIKAEDGGLITKLKVKDFSSKHGGTWYTSNEPHILSWLSTFSNISLTEVDVSRYPHEQDDENLTEILKMDLQNLEVVKLNQQCTCSRCPSFIKQAKNLLSMWSPSGKTMMQLPDSLHLKWLSVSGRAIKAAFQEVRKIEGEAMYDDEVIAHFEDFLIARLKVDELEITDAASIRLRPRFMMRIVAHLGVRLLHFRSEVSETVDDTTECDLGFAVTRGDRASVTNEYWCDGVRFSSPAKIVSIHPFPTRDSVLHLLRARRWFPLDLQLEFCERRSINDILETLPELAQVLFISRFGARVAIHVNTSTLLSDKKSSHVEDLKRIFFTAGFYPVYVSTEQNQTTVKLFYNEEFPDPLRFVINSQP